jgi:dephospho-CoA kinase
VTCGSSGSCRSPITWPSGDPLRIRTAWYRLIPIGSIRPVASLDLADELAGDLLRAGYPRVASIIADAVLGGSESVHPKRFHASADPGRPTHVHIRVAGTSPQQFALLFVDWLASHPGVCPDYLAAKRAGPQSAAQWLGQAHSRARSWAESTGWSPVS